MHFYKWFLNKIILPLGSVVFSGNYLKHIKEWKRLDLKKTTELEALQSKKLAEILNHAKTTVPYYKHLKAKSLTDFPILTKNILRNKVEDLISDTYKIKDLDKHHSSGSSGFQSFTYMTKAHTVYLRSLQTHWWHWSDYEFGDTLLQFGISQNRTLTKKLKDAFLRCTYIKAFGLSDDDFKSILNQFSSKKNVVVAGYPSVINQLAIYCCKHKKKLNLKSVICFGDKLFDHHITTIKTAFGHGVKLVDTYGCAEGLLMACKADSTYYNIMSPHIYLEIVDEHGLPVNDGEQGHVLVTCLTNKAMPLIRYKLGDLAIKLPKNEYPKERILNYPLLKKVVGRETDVIKTTNGTILNVHSFTGVLEYYQDIIQYKIIQYSLEAIVIEYISNNDLENSDILKKIEEKLKKLTLTSISITFKKVEIIKASGSGKPQIIVSYL